MAWYEYLALGYIGLVLMLGIPYVIACSRRPSCPRCYYPLYRCECRTDNGSNVERTVLPFDRRAR